MNRGALIIKCYHFNNLIIYSIQFLELGSRCLSSQQVAITKSSVHIEATICLVAA